MGKTKNPKSFLISQLVFGATSNLYLVIELLRELPETEEVKELLKETQKVHHELSQYFQNKF